MTIDQSCLTRCRDCRWWSGSYGTPDNHGDCAYVATGKGLAQLWQSDYRREWIALNTRPDFGCTEGLPKEAEHAAR